MTLTVEAPAAESGSPAERRRQRRQRLAGALRLFARFGLCEGATGHISARDTDHPELFWINPADRHWSRIRARDLLLVDAAGTLVEGTGPVNPAAIAIHGQLLAARPDAVSVAHAHSVAGK